MTIDLSVILPIISQTLDGTGFIFGAGASREAGYPIARPRHSRVGGNPAILFKCLWKNLM